MAVNYAGYAPENYDEKFNGYVSIEYALEHSLNIPAVKGLRLLGHERMIQKLSTRNFKQIQKDRRKLGLSLILGGCGTTLEELQVCFQHLPMTEFILLRHIIQSDTLRNTVDCDKPGSQFHDQ